MVSTRRWEACTRLNTTRRVFKFPLPAREGFTKTGGSDIVGQLTSYDLPFNAPEGDRTAPRTQFIQDLKALRLEKVRFHRDQGFKRVGNKDNTST